MGCLRRLLVTAIAVAVVPLPSAWAANSKLSTIVPQYPRAELVEFTEASETTTHEIMLGSAKHVAGNITAEKSEFVIGRRVTSTWQVPDEQRTEVVAKFFRERVGGKGEVLFSCEGYGCGSSAYWANSVFDASILYGPEQDQHYFITRIEDDVTYYVATYIALRATRKLYVHTDVIIAEKQGTELSGASIVADLESSGRFVIEAGTETEAVRHVVDAMAQRPLVRIAVVGHKHKLRGETVQETIARSEVAATGYVNQLIAAGVQPTRIEGFGVGPLVPLERDVIDRLEIVLISTD